MHPGRCRTFEEVLGICSLSGGLSQEPHSDAIGSRQDSVQCLAWEEAIVESSPCVRMLGFRPRSERETKEAGLQSHPAIFVGYSISTKQYFVYNPLARTLYRSRDVVSREGKRYTAPNAAAEAILNEHFYREVIKEPKPIEKQPTERHVEEPLDDDSPPDSPKPKKQSRELAGLETSPGDAWKLPAKGSRRNRAGKDMLAEFAQSALENEEFEDMIPIYTAAAISDDHEDIIHDPKSYKAATESPHAEKWDTVIKEALDANGQYQVFGDFVELPEGRKALPSHWVYKIKRDGAGNVQRFKARQVCAGNHQIKGIDYQATYAPTARMGHVRLGLAIAASYDLEIHQMDVCTALFGVDLEEQIYMRPQQGYFRLIPGSRYYDPRSKTSGKMVLRLRKSLYGLKQFLHVWYGTFKDFVTSIGFVPSRVG
jgi:hypothetical protein